MMCPVQPQPPTRTNGANRRGKTEPAARGVTARELLDQRGNPSQLDPADLEVWLLTAVWGAKIKALPANRALRGVARRILAPHRAGLVVCDSGALPRSSQGRAADGEREYRRPAPFHSAFIAAAQEVGFPLLEDPSDPRRPVEAAAVPANVVDGVRWNAAFAYLDPARARPNPSILGDTLSSIACSSAGRRALARFSPTAAGSRRTRPC
jgi:hypothetical protein